MRLEFVLFPVAFLTQKLISQVLNIKITFSMMYSGQSVWYHFIHEVGESLASETTHEESVQFEGNRLNCMANTSILRLIHSLENGYNYFAG